MLKLSSDYCIKLLGVPISLPFYCVCGGPGVFSLGKKYVGVSAHNCSDYREM